MRKKVDLVKSLLDTWSTTHQVTVYLIRNIPPDLWNKKIPGYPRKTIGTLAIHLHHARRWWIKIIQGKTTLRRIADKQATRKEVILALNKSHKAMLDLLTRCIDNGGQLPAKVAWLNFPNDMMHLLTYFVAHEAHHRGQIIMAARQLGHALPRELAAGLWQWTKRLKESVKKSKT